MEKSQYIPIMIQSLKKKNQILDVIISLNQQQRYELEDPGLDPDDFDLTVEKKAEQIKELESLDVGFQELFERIREELTGNREAYREEITQMQELIRSLVEKSVDIQTQEQRNKDLMTRKFAAVRKQVKEVRQSQKIVNQYYKNMMKTAYIESQFTDNKK